MSKVYYSQNWVVLNSNTVPLLAIFKTILTYVCNPKNLSPHCTKNPIGMCQKIFQLADLFAFCSRAADKNWLRLRLGPRLLKKAKLSDKYTKKVYWKWVHIIQIFKHITIITRSLEVSKPVMSVLTALGCRKLCCRLKALEYDIRYFFSVQIITEEIVFVS